MHHIIIGIVFLLICPVQVLAQGLEEGQKAYQAGDYQTALKILMPLAEQGNSQAQAMLGIMYDNGQGVAKDPGESLKWYIMAAKQGLPVAQHDVGVKYFQGIGVTQDYTEAAKWWEQAANAGLADSQFNLGLMYYRGLGLETDYLKAADLFRRASEQGHGQAQYSLGVMYAFGQGMDKSHAEALKWFRESAVQSISQAQFNLGVFYENGYGVDKDMNLARQWYQRAADQGLEEAREKLAAWEAQGSVPSKEVVVTHPEPSTLSQINVKTPAKQTPVADQLPPVAQTPEDPGGNIKREDWIWQQRPGTYTLQLASLLNESDAREFIISNKLESSAAYMKVVINGTTRYTVIYGMYNTYDQAQRALKSLPPDLRREKPWVRNFGQLQKMLK